MNAVKRGINLAKDLSANVLMLYVLDMHTIISSITENTKKNNATRDLELIVEEKADKLLDETLSKYPYDKITPIAIEGSPAEEIHTIAQEHQVDLIVMGTHGRTGLKRLLMGSVAEHVLRYSKIPVMVVSSHKE